MTTLFLHDTTPVLHGDYCVLGSSVAPGDSFASAHANARPDEAELFSFFFLCVSNSTIWNLGEKAGLVVRPDEEHPEGTP